MSKHILAVMNGDKMAITYRGETREFEARRHPVHAMYYARSVFSGKVGFSGTKNWPVEVILWDSGNIALNGGFANKGKLANVVGWFNPESENNSQFKGKR